MASKGHDKDKIGMTTTIMMIRASHQDDNGMTVCSASEIRSNIVHDNVGGEQNPEMEEHKDDDRMMNKANIWGKDDNRMIRTKSSESFPPKKS